MRFRPAVDVEDQRSAAARCAADRLDQHALDFLPVARGIGEGALLAEVDFGQPGIVLRPAVEGAVFPDEQFARVLRAVGLDRQRVSAGLDAGEDQRAAVMLFGDRAIGIVDPQRALCALVDHCGKPPVGKPFGIHCRFGRTRIQRAVAAAGHVDQVQRGVRRVVHVDARDHRQLRAVGRDFDVAQLARRFDHAQHLAVRQVDHMRALGGIGIVDLRGGRAVDHRVAAIGRDAEGADIAGDRDCLGLGIDLGADTRGEQPRQLGLFLVDHRIEPGLGLLRARLVFLGAGQHPDRAAVGRPGVGAHRRALDRGQLALRAAIDGDAPDRGLLVPVGPGEGDHPAIGREGHARHADVVGQEVARIVRAVGKLELLLRGPVLLALGHVGQAGGGVGDAAAVGRDGNGAHGFKLGDVFRRHRAGLCLRGERGGGEQGGGGQRRAKCHAVKSSRGNCWRRYSAAAREGKPHRPASARTVPRTPQATARQARRERLQRRHPRGAGESARTVAERWASHPTTRRT